MRSAVSLNEVSSVRPFIFESFGVNIRIESNRQEMLDDAEQVVRKSLLNWISPLEDITTGHTFTLLEDHGNYLMFRNQEEIASGESKEIFFKFFDSMIRIVVAEYAVDRVFLHAGVVGWRGKAIVLPANSFEGKSTLVAELVRHGAVYYSDDYAIFDENGFVHPFPRPLTFRTQGINIKPYEISLESIGGVRGELPLRVGFVLLTGYRPRAKWDPKVLSPGQGVLEMIPFTISLNHKPDFSLNVLNKISNRATIAASYRGTAEKFAKTILDFVDKRVG